MDENKPCPCDSIQLLKSDDGHFYIYGPASVEIKDKQNDKIRASALETSLSQLIRRGRLSYGHQDVIVGEILPEATIGGKLYKTHVTHDRMMVLGDIWDDTEASQEARQKSQSGVLKSYSISGQIRKGGSTRVCDSSGCFRDVFKIDQHAVTLCEEGMNPGAHYEVLQKGDVVQYKTFATENKGGMTSSSEEIEVQKEMADIPKTEIKPPETEVAKTDMAPTAGGGDMAEIKGLLTKILTLMSGGGADQVQNAQKAAVVPEVKPEAAVSKADIDAMKLKLTALEGALSKTTVSTTPRPDAIKKEVATSPIDEIIKNPALLDKLTYKQIAALEA